MNMTEPADKNDDSDWDFLASELGLEPPAPQAKPKPHVVPEPAKEEVVPNPADVELSPAFEVAPKPSSRKASAHVDVMEDTVLENGPEEFGDLEPLADPTEPAEAPPASDEALAGEAGPEGEGGGRRRRRRRRRKKGPGEPAAGAEPSHEGEEAGIEDEITVGEPAAAFEDEVVEESVEIVGEAAPELEDDDEEGEDVSPPHAAIEELDDDSTEPLPDWKVTSWTDLVATLFRPQDR
jgi:ribonuclease E